jgi:hypothetical protein
LPYLAVWQRKQRKWVIWGKGHESLKWMGQSASIVAKGRVITMRIADGVEIEVSLSRELL